MVFPDPDHPDPPIPSSLDLLRQVDVDPMASGTFLYGGYLVAEGLRRGLDVIQRPLHGFSDILDFGCGSARVLRWFSDAAGTSRLHGTDINAEAIEWCRRHIPFAAFTVNDPKPPLGFPDQSFDLIYGISVMTHLDEAFQLAWLAEFQRVLRPGGIVALTIHEDELTNWNLSPAEMVRYRRQGHLYRRGTDDGGMDGLPDFYQVAYHTREYIERVWSRYFRLRAYIKHGPMYLQTLLILEHTGADPVESRERGLAQGRQPSHGEGPYVVMDLPLGCLDAPHVGDRVQTDALAIRGWSFHPDGGRVTLDVWIDDERTGSCIAEEPRPDAALIFPRHPTAVVSGFSTTAWIDTLSEGPHRVWVSARTNQVPLVATYFFKGAPSRGAAAPTR